MTTSPAPSREQLVLDPDDIDQLPREAMHPGVAYTILWRRAHSAAGVLWIEPGACVPEHTHAAAEHHVWLTEGSAEVDGRTVGPGAYWHVPAGVQHGVVAAASGGAKLFYLYLRQ
jgi:anti-sigma factor ChrR (cupin superfamily)